MPTGAQLNPILAVQGCLIEPHFSDMKKGVSRPRVVLEKNARIFGQSTSGVLGIRRIGCFRGALLVLFSKHYFDSGFGPTHGKQERKAKRLFFG